MLEGGGKTPILTPHELEEVGYKLAVYPLSLMGVSLRAMQVTWPYPFLFCEKNTNCWIFLLKNKINWNIKGNPKTHLEYGGPLLAWSNIILEGVSGCQIPNACFILIDECCIRHHLFVAILSYSLSKIKEDIFL